MTPLYAEEIHMLEGINDEELETYLEENPRIVPLFEIDVIETSDAYVISMALEIEDCEPDIEALMELFREQGVFNREMEISQCVTTSALKEINDSIADVPQPLSIAKNLPPSAKAAMIDLLHEY